MKKYVILLFIFFLAACNVVGPEVRKIEFRAEGSSANAYIFISTPDGEYMFRQNQALPFEHIIYTTQDGGAAFSVSTFDRTPTENSATILINDEIVSNHSGAGYVNHLKVKLENKE